MPLCTIFFVEYSSLLIALNANLSIKFFSFFPFIFNNNSFKEGPTFFGFMFKDDQNSKYQTNVCFPIGSLRIRFPVAA